MGEAVMGSIAGGVASSVVGSVLGGGKQSYTPNQYQKIPGVEFQPFTYKTGAGSVTGEQVGKHGYEWSADVAPWLQELGTIGQEGAGGLFQDYLSTAQVDPYAAAEEFYSRGKAQLDPEIARQRVRLGESMFGSGRLGLKMAGEGTGYGLAGGSVNPDLAGFGTGVGKAYQDLYTQSLMQGQQLQTGRLNQLQTAAQSMLNLGMKPSDVERELIKEAMAQEVARSNALKQGTQAIAPQESPQSVMAGQIGGLVGQGVQGMFNSGPSTGQSWGSFGSNMINGGMWSGNTGLYNSSGSSYYDPMNDFYAW